MAGSIQIDRTGSPPRHRFNISKVGMGMKHTNRSPRKQREMVIRIGAFTVEAGLSFLPPKTTLEEAELLAISRSVAGGVECVVDTGATFSMFRSEIARELGLEPDNGKMVHNSIEVFGGAAVDCCRSRHVLYLDIGPYPIAVPVAFPVVALRRGAMLEYQWLDGFPEENILGMEDILNQRMLCFTPDFLFVFENRP